MSNGGISASGRALRWALWRAPRGALSYTIASNMALASDLGRRWIVFAVFGAYLWSMRWVAVHMVPPLRTISAVLLLLWFWHGVNLVKWSLHARAQAARARSLQREMYQTVQQLPDQVRQAARSISVPGGVNTVRGLLSQPDPEYAAQRRQAAGQADQVRGMLPDEHRDMPLGDRFEPVFRLPRWLRRRRP